MHFQGDISNVIDNSDDIFNKHFFRDFNLSIFHLNVQSLHNKITELQVFLNSKPFDIFCVSEHWLDINSLDKIKLNKYSLIASFCRQTKEMHGGVAIYTTSKISVRRIDIGRFCRSFDAEFCAIEVRHCSLAVITVYRSPTKGNMSVFIETLTDLVEFLNNKYKKIIIMGDMNLDLDGNTDHAKNLCNLFNMYGFSHLIHQPT